MSQLFDYALETKSDPRLLDNEKRYAKLMPYPASMTLNNLSHDDEKLNEYYRTYPNDEKRNEFKEIIKPKRKFRKFRKTKKTPEINLPLNLYYGISNEQDTSLFKQSDRIILTSKMIEKVFNPYYLIHKKFLYSYRAFH